MNIEYSIQLVHAGLTQLYVVTLLHRNLTTVCVLGSLGQELDPMLHLGHTAVNPVAGALTPIANNSHLGESKYIK